MEKSKHVTRNMKRVRSDSYSEIDDGRDDELEDRYYRVTIYYIKSLMFSGIISRSIYSEILTSGVIDKIINRKCIDGIESIYETKHEEKLCNRYIKKQRINEVSAWTSLFSVDKKKRLKHGEVPCHMLCNDLMLCVRSFL